MLCFAMIADRGLIDYDRTVADYWPEIAVHSKGEITVAMLLSHQAGLTGFVGDVRSQFGVELSVQRVRKAASRLRALTGRGLQSSVPSG